MNLRIKFIWREKGILILLSSINRVRHKQLDNSFTLRRCLLEGRKEGSLSHLIRVEGHRRQKEEAHPGEGMTSGKKVT